MVPLVDILRVCFDLETIASCGGHENLYGKLNPAPFGEFYVSFVLSVEDSDGERNEGIKNIRRAIEKTDGKVTLKNLSKEEPNKFPVFRDHYLWNIEGKDFDPYEFAAMLHTEHESNEKKGKK